MKAIPLGDKIRLVAENESDKLTVGFTSDATLRQDLETLRGVVKDLLDVVRRLNDRVGQLEGKDAIRSLGERK